MVALAVPCWGRVVWLGWSLAWLGDPRAPLVPTCYCWCGRGRCPPSLALLVPAECWPPGWQQPSGRRGFGFEKQDRRVPWSWRVREEPRWDRAAQGLCSGLHWIERPRPTAEGACATQGWGWEGVQRGQVPQLPPLPCCVTPGREAASLSPALWSVSWLTWDLLGPVLFAGLGPLLWGCPCLFSTRAPPTGCVPGDPHPARGASEARPLPSSPRALNPQGPWED